MENFDILKEILNNLDEIEFANLLDNLDLTDAFDVVAANLAAKDIIKKTLSARRKAEAFEAEEVVKAKRKARVESIMKKLPERKTESSCIEDEEAVKVDVAKQECRDSIKKTLSVIRQIEPSCIEDEEVVKIMMTIAKLRKIKLFCIEDGEAVKVDVAKQALRD